MAHIAIFVGTVYGTAQLIAEEAEQFLTQHGHDVCLFEEGELDDWLEYSESTILIITSTTGQGNLPDTIEPLYQEIKDELVVQDKLQYGIIALGDSSYDYFCGAGKLFEQLLQEHHATRLGGILQLDAQIHTEPEVEALQWLEEWVKLLN